MQRHMPLGYKITKGIITVDKEKAEIVRRIFMSFISGKSMLKISQELTGNGIPNANGKPSRNHCSVGNILKNIKYIGDEYHPAVITENDYQTAEKIQQERARHPNHNNNYLANSKTGIYPYSGKLICGECDAIFKRYTEHHNANKKCNWKCKSYIVNNRVFCRSAVIDDTQLEQAFIDVINKVLKEPKLIDIRGQNKAVKPKKINKSGQETAQQPNEKNIDPNEKIRKLFSKATEEYINCSVNDFKYQTNKLRKILSNLTSVDSFDRGLFLQIIRHITINVSGTLRFEFINGAVVETEYESRRKTLKLTIEKEESACREQEEQCL